MSGILGKTIRFSSGTICLALLTALSASTAIAQQSNGSSGPAAEVPDADKISSKVVNIRPAADKSEFLTPEYYANWGLNLHDFAAAYAAGATGQGTILGQMDTPMHQAHPEFEGRDLRSFPGTNPALIGQIDKGESNWHGQHVGGIIVAKRDGKGMHGGAFNAKTFYNTDLWDWPNPTLSDIVASGADFINHSYGYNLPDYQKPVYETPGGAQIGVATTRLDELRLSTRPNEIESSSIRGVVNVTAAGNDRYYATTLATNRYDARPRLFRGLTPGGSMSLISYLAAENKSISDADWKKLEKNTVTAVMLNGTEEISSYSNLCGISKYSCIGTAGGMLAEPKEDYRVSLPELGLPVYYYYPDSTGYKYIEEQLKGEIWASQYRILSTATRNPLGPTASAAEAQASLESIYMMALGTSMAAPTLTAGLGVTKSRFPYLENWQIRDVVLTTGRDIGAPGIDRVYGWGIMDLAAAMGGPRKLFALKREYLDRSIDRTNGEKNLFDYEVEQAKLYERDVAIADKFATEAYDLKVQIIELGEALKTAEAELTSPDVSLDRIAELRSLIDANRQKISELEPQEQAARARAYELELTRVQSNLEGDTEEAAFESIIWNVNLPGKRTEECDSDFCIADFWTNDIDGPGGLNKLGEGTLALAGSNTYRGGTTVSGGALQFGLGGETGSVEGDIVNNSSVYVVRSNIWQYDGVISGIGDLNIVSDGGLLLTNANTFTGGTNVVRGTFAVDGSVVSNTNLFDGAILTGGGEVAGIDARGGSYVIPGGSERSDLVSNGDVTFRQGSTLVALYDDTKANTLIVNGRATSSNADILLESTAATLEDFDKHELSLIDQHRTVLTTTNGTDGNFNVKGLSQKRFLETDVTIGASDVLVGYSRNDQSFEVAGETDNQKILADVVETLGRGNSIYDQVLLSNQGDALAPSLQSLSGEIHANTTTFLAASSRQTSDAVGNRLRGANGVTSSSQQATVPASAYGPTAQRRKTDAFDAFTSNDRGVVLWGEVFKSWSTFDDSGVAGGFKGDNAGLISGADLDFQTSGYDGRIGIFGGHRSGSVNAGAGGRSSVDTYLAGLYSNFVVDAFRVSLGASYNWYDISTNRSAFV